MICCEFGMLLIGVAVPLRLVSWVCIQVDPYVHDE